MNLNFRSAALSIHELATGRHILPRLEDLNRTQWLSRDELNEIQQRKLINLVDYANKYVPYYQRIFKEAAFHPEDLHKNIAYFNNIPILDKSIIRRNWNDMLTTEPTRRQKLSKLSTSGSTGEPLVFMQDSDFRDTVTADVQRHMGWAGWSLGDPQAVIWGSNLHPSSKDRIRTRLIDWVWNRDQANAFAITDENWAIFTKKVLEKRPKILFGYTSGVQRFAQYIRSRPDYDITFNGIFTSAEKLLPPVRSYIEETFHCKVFNRYGTFELGGLACECPAHDGLHISLENNYIEILQDGVKAEAGETGDLVITNLINRGMPFIRYAIGDAGSWALNKICSCGRAAPRLQAVDGRIKDAFFTRDGRTVYTGFSGYSFECLASPGIKQFQIIQKTLDRIIVRLETESELSQSILDEITRAFRGAFGENIDIDFEIFDTLPTLPSGKHQYSWSEINITK